MDVRQSTYAKPIQNIKTKSIVSSYSKQSIPDLRLTLNNIPIKLLESVKYLGVHLDSSLKFLYHIQTIEKKISAAIGILCKLKHYASVNILLSVYYMLLSIHI